MVNQQFATALHILTALGVSEGKLVSSEALAKSVRANPVLIRRIIGLLSDAKLVETVRGSAGGVRLARAAEKIDLAQIFSALEPTPFISKREKKGDPKCPVGCRMDALVSDLSQEAGGEMLKFLEKKSLAAIVSKIRDDS
jgi:Rrf2 family protein